MIKDQNRTYDGWSSLAGGQDAGKRANLIGPDQAEKLENCVCRGGSGGTRPAFTKRTLNFLNNVTYDELGGHSGTVFTDSETAFKEGLFQAAHYYDPSIDDDAIIVSIAGRIFQVVPRTTTADVTELRLDKRNRSNIPIAYMEQADRFILIQDGESSCIIYDGTTIRRAKQDEIPVGTIMAYGMGRVVLVGTNRRDILFGDLFGSHEGDPSDSILKFTETTFLSEGGAASIPFTMGHIKGAIFYPQSDTTSGQGELLIFAEKGIASFFLSLPRNEWKTSQFQRMALLEIGGRGHRAFTPVNTDVWFRSGDGWRLYRQARAESKGYSQLPLSTEVSNYVDVETERLLEFASSIRFDNRLIASCTAYPNQGRLFHKGFVSLDFNVLSSFGQATKPSWDGHWNGLKVLQLIEGNFRDAQRAFVFGIDEENENALYEITDHAADSTGPITSSITSRAFNFQAPYNETRVYDGDAWFDRVRANTTVSVYFKPDQYPRWLPWRTSENCPLDTITPIDHAAAVGGILLTGEGFKPRRSFGKPPTICDDLATERDTKRCYEAQVKIVWTGNAAISRFRLSAQTLTEKSTANA